MKQKILHIISGDLWGGAEAQVLVQILELLKLGVDVEVLLFNDGTVAERFAEAGIKTHIASEESNALSFLRQAFSKARSIQPQLIVSHGYKEALVAWRTKKSQDIPWVATFHGLTEAYVGWKAFKMKCYLSIYRHLVASAATRIVCVSQAMAASLGYSKSEKLRVIYNANTALPGKSIETSLKQPAIVMLGRLARVKRVELGIAAFEAYVSSLESESWPQLYIIGDGPERPALEILPKPEVLGNVHFLGFQKGPWEILAQAQLFLLTSDSEGLPSSLLEAASLGVPAVCTRVGGIPEVADLLSSYPVYLAEAGDVEGLAEGIAQGLAQSPSADEKEAWVAEFERNFSPEVIAKQHLEMYQELLPRTL